MSPAVTSRQPFFLVFHHMRYDDQYQRMTNCFAESGDVYTCGYNDRCVSTTNLGFQQSATFVYIISGQCGIGSTSRVQSLHLVPSLVNKKIANIRSANGCEHLTAISSAYQFYAELLLQLT